VNFRGNVIGSDGSYLLQKLLTSKQVRKLDLGHCCLTTSSLEELVAGLAVMNGTMV